ncbi:hypothetical protein C1A50_0256 [Paenibacillus polymyxa]|nr:hypothetical protein C1A50_0256 [Paenibacillus polymyxa]
MDIHKISFFALTGQTVALYTELAHILVPLKQRSHFPRGVRNHGLQPII